MSSMHAPTLSDTTIVVGSRSYGYSIPPALMHMMAPSTCANGSRNPGGAEHAGRAGHKYRAGINAC